MEQLRKPLDLTVDDDDTNKEESVRGVSSANYENLREKIRETNQSHREGRHESSVLVGADEFVRMEKSIC